MNSLDTARGFATAASAFAFLGTNIAQYSRSYELMADNATATADPQGGYDDWIELHNRSATAADITGRFLTDDPTQPRKWAFPADTFIPPGGFLVVWADADASAHAGLHASFKLEKTGEPNLLIDSDAHLNAVLDSVSFGAQARDRSFGRSAADPERFVEMDPTPGAPNTGP
jgi:hypothetical protein